jgi:integrase
MMATVFFRPNQKGQALAASGKRLTKQAPTYGTWWLRYTDAAGRRVRERSGARLQEEAERLAQEKELKAERVRAGLETGAPTPMSCAQLFEKYLAASAHLSSQAPMRSQVRRWFGPHFGRMPVATVTPADCDALLTKAREAGQAPATVRQLHIRGRLLFDYAVTRLQARRDNPWAAIPRPEVPRRAPRFLAKATAAAIISAAGPFRLLLLTDLLTGMRRGELGGLQWDDLAWGEGKHGRIYVRRSWDRVTTKGRKVRVLPIHPDLRPELEAAFRAAPRGADGRPTEPYVFPAPRRGGMRNESWHTAKLVRSIAKRAGITLPPGFVFHDLRKTFGTHVLRATGDLTAVQRLLGHSSPSVTEAVYIGEDLDLLTESVEKLDFAPPSAPAAEHTVSTRRLRLVPGLPRGSKKG